MCRAPASTVQGQDIFNLDRMDRRHLPTRGGGAGGVSSPTQDKGNIFNIAAGTESDHHTPTNTTHPNLLAQALKLQEPECTKWSCTACTYYNYARAVRCTQCLTPRPKKVSPTSLPHSRLSPGSPRSSPTPSIAACNQATALQQQQPLLSQQQHTGTAGSGGLPATTSISTVNRENAIRSLADQFQPLRICDAAPLEAESSSVSRNSGSQASNYQHPGTRPQQQQQNINSKWSCLACTYENWQRSKSCVLCGVERGRKSPPSTQSGVDRGRKSPPSTPPLAHHAQSLPRENSDQGASKRRIEMGGSGDRRSGSGGGSGGSDRRASPECATAGPVNSSTDTPPASSSPVVGGAIAGSNCNIQYEKRLRQLRRRMRETDWAWVSACMGVVEGDVCPVEAYINSGGDPTRKLNQSEANILDRPGIFEPGLTLVHLALKFHREDLLATLLSQIEGLSSPPVKRVPSYVAPDLAAAIRRQIALSLRHRKGGFPCLYLCDSVTYTLPPEIHDLPNIVQDEMYKELLDNDAKAELESELCINWSNEVSRVFPLWNRSAGDCLLDAVLQATWGVFDRDNMLRRALADSLTEAGHVFYPRWKEWETRQAQELSFVLADSQWEQDWADLLALAGQPGASLEQLHIFCLAHVLRRPIIVYGVKYVKSWRGENLGYAKFEGVYLPLLWEPAFCYRTPLALGYTRGHFCALIPPEPTAVGGIGAGAMPPSPPQAACNYLPLVTSEREVLPLHFTSRTEVGQEESLLRQWMDVGFTESGIMVAQQPALRPPLLVAQMTEEWLNYYRKIAQSTSVPVVGGVGVHPPRILLESSDDSTDDDC